MSQAVLAKVIIGFHDCRGFTITQIYLNLIMPQKKKILFPGIVILLLVFILLPSYSFVTNHRAAEDKEYLLQIGRRMFYDASLSADGAIACATCHQQKYAFSYGIDVRYPKHDDKVVRDHSVNERSILPLFNLSVNERFMWDGRVKKLTEQVLVPIHSRNEFNTTIKSIVAKLNRDSIYKRLHLQFNSQSSFDSVDVINAFALFESSLISDNSKYDQYLRGQATLDSAELKGYALMSDPKKGNCFSCHSLEVQNGKQKQGLKKNGMPMYQEPEIKLRTPSLRNLVYTNPYGHNGGFDWVDAVIEFYNSRISEKSDVSPEMRHYIKGSLNLSKDEKLCMLRFLASLNDETFVSDPRFSSPFNN